MAGVVWGVRDHTKEPEQASLKETRFQWIDPLPKELQKGILDDQEVPCVKVGTFVWPKYPKKLDRGSNATQGMSPLCFSGAYAQLRVRVRHVIEKPRPPDTGPIRFQLGH
jgi:hypothetical protein